VRQSTTAVLHRRGHAEESLRRQLAQSRAILLFVLRFESVFRQLTPGEVGHHAFDGHLIFGQLHRGPAPSSSTTVSSIRMPWPGGSTSSGLISTLLTAGGSAAASCEMRTTAAARSARAARTWLRICSNADRTPSAVVRPSLTPPMSALWVRPGD